MCQMEAGEIGRIHVLRHLEGWLGRKVQLSSPAVQPKYIFSCHHGSARSTVFSDFEKARAKFNEIGDGFARVLSDTAGRVYLSYFFPEYDNVRTEVMDCHYRKIKEEIYSSKTFAVVYHHPVKGLQSDLFPDYKAASVHFDTLNLAKLLRDGNGNIYDCEFKPYASKYRDQVLKHAAGLKI
ncbi:hypothetical protein BC829DRAFT_385302 [Chytridium lagenaria]|nr:hypothetical protein BC829DRAFT_385302 [Chytridium lagenaria]